MDHDVTIFRVNLQDDETRVPTPKEDVVKKAVGP
jgi:hypothetical protein